MDNRTKKLLFDVLSSGRSSNRIIHGYDTVDDATVWGIAEGHLPRLIQQAETLLADADA